MTPRLTRRAALAAAFAAASSPSALAQESVPLRLVRGFYAPGFDQLKMPMSRSLKRLLAAALARSKKDDAPVAGLDFAWTTDSQDTEEGWEKTLAFKVASSTRSAAKVEVTFRNGGPKRLVYLVVLEDGRWVVDDITYADTGDTLGGLLRRGAAGED